MKVRCALFAIAAAVPLAACQTAADSWAAADQGLPFNRAERTCEDQQDFIAEEDARPAFFVKCMAAFGWTPKSGTRYARVAESLVPS